MSSAIQQQSILILDFGSQYTQLIARRVREAGVYSEILPWDIEPERIAQFNPKGIVLSGGPETVTGDDAPAAPAIVFSLGVPVLGICYGMQTMAAQLGGKVETSEKREFGYAKVRLLADTELTRGISDDEVDTGVHLDVWTVSYTHLTLPTILLV